MNEKTQGTTMHVYHNNVTEWVVAESPEDAARLCKEYNGNAGVEEDELDLEFRLWPDDRKLKVNDEDTGEVIEKTGAEWAAESEPGFLCTTEY